MSKVILCQYKNEVEVDQWYSGPEVVVRPDSLETILNKEQCENLAATLVGMSGVYDGKLSFKCASGDNDEVSLRRRGNGGASMFFGSGGLWHESEIILSRDGALALAMELIRMATHE